MIYDTSTFGEPTGNLRVDYVLPSQDLTIQGAEVFWPETAYPNESLVAASDHRLVDVDLEAAPPAEAKARLDVKQDGGVLVVTGTKADDVITISQEFRHIVVHSGVRVLENFRREDVDHIVMYGNGENDVLSIGNRLDIGATLLGVSGDPALKR